MPALCQRPRNGSRPDAGWVHQGVYQYRHLHGFWRIRGLAPENIRKLRVGIPAEVGRVARGDRPGEYGGADTSR